jgi:hypothetical protein
MGPCRRRYPPSDPWSAGLVSAIVLFDVHHDVQSDLMQHERWDRLRRSVIRIPTSCNARFLESACRFGR